MLDQWTSVRNFEDLDLDGVFSEFGRDCERDDRWTFDGENRLLMDQGFESCDTIDNPADEVIKSGWRLEQNDQYLTVEFEYDQVSFFIQSIDPHELVLQRVDIENPGVCTQKVVLNR